METIKPGKYVELVYRATATDPASGGVFTMDFSENRPDSFVYGVEKGLIEQLETLLLDKPQGYQFNIAMTPEQTAKEFGERDPEAVIALDKAIFEVEGKFDSKNVALGRVLPMMTDDGYQIQGMVIDISDQKVTMDFNHPFAQKALNYTGYVKTVRDATADDMPQHGCGCGCERHGHHDECHGHDGGCDDCCGCE